jgi:hypothetical protein
MVSVRLGHLPSMAESVTSIHQRHRLELDNRDHHSEQSAGVAVDSSLPHNNQAQLLHCNFLPQPSVQAARSSVLCRSGVGVPPMVLM